MESRGYEIFSSSKKKWRKVYDNKKNMRVLYNGWERWITTTGADIKIGDGSKTTFQTVMVSWCEGFSQTLKMGEKQDDEETWGLEGGYSLERGISRHSLDFYSGKLGENLSDGKTLMGRMKGVHHCLQEQKRGFAKMNSDDVLASPTKNTRKRKSTIPTVDSPAMATRGKRGNK